VARPYPGECAARVDASIAAVERWLFSLFAQAPAVVAGDPVDGVGQVAEQVPAIGHLDRIRRADSGTFGVASGAVSADDLRAGMARSQSAKVPRADPEQLHRLMGVHVDQHGAVGVAASEGKVVDTTAAKLPPAARKGTQQPQQRRA